jgi:hypothetical protein
MRDVQTELSFKGLIVAAFGAACERENWNAGVRTGYAGFRGRRLEHRDCQLRKDRI